MIYDCLECKAPQQPGAVSCPHCGARFDGAVPADATMPTPQTPAPTAQPDLAQGHAPQAPEWVMPAPAETTEQGMGRMGRPVSPAALIAATAVGLIAIGVVLFFLFNTAQSPTATTATPTAAVPTPVPPAVVLPAAAAPVAAAPQGGTQPTPAVTSPAVSSPGVGSAPTLPAPIGRWMTKAFEFYEFDGDGSGSRGSMGSSKPAETFRWVTTGNQLNLILNGNGGTETVPFSYGPGSDSLYLRQADGHYLDLTLQGQTGGATSPAASGGAGSP